MENQMFYRHTDMAEECCGDLDLEKGVRGIRFREEQIEGFGISRLSVCDEEGEAVLGKPKGEYVTVTVGKAWLLSEEELAAAVRVLANELKIRMLSVCPKMTSILVVGLGNRQITSDAIGPFCVDHVTVSRHVKELDPPLFARLSRLSLAAIAPGVVGQTGIETVELIRGAVNHVRPSLVLCIDALAARSVDRLGVTVQLSDNGIAPGSGIGNHRKNIDQEALGVPVISLGVPTVVDSSTLVYGMLEKAGVTELSDPLKKELNNGRSFFVTLKEADIATAEMAKLLANAIDLALAL